MGMKPSTREMWEFVVDHIRVHGITNFIIRYVFAQFDKNCEFTFIVKHNLPTQPGQQPFFNAIRQMVNNVFQLYIVNSSYPSTLDVRQTVGSVYLIHKNILGHIDLEVYEKAIDVLFDAMLKVIDNDSLVDEHYNK